MPASVALVTEGVTLIHSYEATLRFRFAELNAIKPEMIADAPETEAAPQC